MRLSGVVGVGSHCRRHAAALERLLSCRLLDGQLSACVDRVDGASAWLLLLRLHTAAEVVEKDAAAVDGSTRLQVLLLMLLDHEQGSCSS